MGWLLDLCPPDYRGYSVVTRQPVVLAWLAGHHLEGQLQATRRALATARADLLGSVPPPALRETLEAVEEEAGPRRRGTAGAGPRRTGPERRALRPQAVRGARSGRPSARVPRAAPRRGPPPHRPALRPGAGALALGRRRLPHQSSRRGAEEPRRLRPGVRVVAPPRAVVVPLRHVDVQRPARPGDGDVEQPALLLQPCRRRQRHVGGERCRRRRGCRCTTSHSRPLAECTVERTSQSSSIDGGPARSPVERGGSSARSAATSDSRARRAAAATSRVEVGQPGGGVARRPARRAGPAPRGSRSACDRAGSRRPAASAPASASACGRGGRGQLRRRPAATAAGRRAGARLGEPQGVDGPAGGGRADAVEQLQQPEPGQLVARVVGQPEQPRAGP